MIGLAELMEPTFCWRVIEEALRKIPPAKWDAASRVGYTTDSGGALVRITISDDLRRELERVAGRPLVQRITAACPPSASPTTTAPPDAAAPP